MYLNRILLGAALALVAAPVLAQTDYPAKPVRIIVPFGPGGAADTLPRLLAQHLSPMWGQPVVVENRTGAAGNIGMEQGAKAAPDGYTLTSAPVGNLAINPHLYSKLSFDVLKDFTPITLVASVQNVLVLNPAVPANNLKELIAYAKTRPGMLTYGSGGVGTQAHIGGEIFEAMAGVHMVHVAYRGVGDSVRDLLGGQVDMIFAQIPAVKPHIDSGKLRALGVASPKRTPALPDVPTIDEAAGLTGFQAVSWYAIVGPAGMPPAVTAKIQADAAKVIQLPEVRTRLQGLGAEPVGSTPAELSAAIKADYDRYGTVIKRLGIKAD
ncbi:MAG TPA: tripartite tricarboxylate transporter substrate binding protein [Burkholderiales bacterium]|nr:tripartite tricarboxylate transporter substrate binding protein [Burkholderiales bacterium]